MTPPKKRNTVFVNVALSEAAREILRQETVWASAQVGYRLSAGDALAAMLRVAHEHPDEVRAAVDYYKADAP